MLLSFSTNVCRMFNGTLRDILLKLRDILLRLRVIIDSISDVILWREEYSRYDIARSPNNKKITIAHNSIILSHPYLIKSGGS